MEGFLPFDAAVFEAVVTEDEYASLGDQKGKFVLLRIIQLRELQTSDLGADDRRKLADLDVRVVLGEDLGLFFVATRPRSWNSNGCRGSKCPGVCGLVVDRQIRLVSIIVLKRYRITLSKLQH